MQRAQAGGGGTTRPLEEIEADLHALMGVTDDDPSPGWRSNIHNATLSCGARQQQPRGGSVWQ
jgi:hypothetical protein